MTEFVVYNNQIQGQQYQNRLESKANKKMNAFIFTTKIACHNAHILKVYNGQYFKHALCWCFCQAHFMFFVLKTK